MDTFETGGPRWSANIIRCPELLLMSGSVVSSERETTIMQLMSARARRFLGSLCRMFCTAATIATHVELNDTNDNEDGRERPWVHCKLRAGWNLGCKEIM